MHRSESLVTVAALLGVCAHMKQHLDVSFYAQSISYITCNPRVALSKAEGGDVRSGSRKAHREVNICASWDIPEVGFKDLPPAFDIRVGDGDMAVKATRPHQSLVKGLWKVCGCNADHAFTGLEPAETSDRDGGRKIILGFVKAFMSACMMHQNQIAQSRMLTKPGQKVKECCNYVCISNWLGSTAHRLSCPAECPSQPEAVGNKSRRSADSRRHRDSNARLEHYNP